jgi:hypothetical protein
MVLNRIILDLSQTDQPTLLRKLEIALTITADIILFPVLVLFSGLSGSG